MMTIFILQTTLPLALIVWLAILPPHDRAGFWMLVLAAALVTLFAALQGIWLFPPWWVPYLMALLLLGTITRHLIRSPVKPWLPTGPWGWLSLVILAGIAGLAGSQSRAALLARHIPDGPSIALAWPLGTGIYLVANGGRSSSINAHAALLDPSHPLHAGYGGTGYGVDLIAINRWGLRADSIMPADRTRYAIFETPVLAPCAGRVVSAVDGRPDNTVPDMPEGNVAGNHIILRCDGIDVLLAHFRQGSLRVVAGDDLVLGQQVGEVGNSGESSEPHLHIHAQMPGSPRDPFSGVPVPILLEDRFLVRGDRVDMMASPDADSS